MRKNDVITNFALLEYPFMHVKHEIMEKSLIADGLSQHDAHIIHRKSMITRQRLKNSMLKLKNIKSSNGIIYADYEPENSGITGKISIRISDKEVISSVVSEYDKEFPIYLQHAILALKKLIGIEELPKEKLVMWY